MWKQEDDKFKVIFNYIASEGQHERCETSLYLRNKEAPKSLEKEWVPLYTEIIINELLIS